MRLTRRDALVGSAATAAAVALPNVAFAAPVGMPLAAPPNVGWLVGQEDRMNWERIYAPTKEDAIREWATQHHGGDCCEDCGRNFVTGECAIGEGGEPFDDDCCSGFPLRVDRVKQIDPYEGKEVPDKVKYRLGWWIPDCSRCDFQGTDDHSGEASDYGRIVGEHFVCEDCVTLADLKECDPQEYAEQIDELLTTEYGEEINT